MPTTSTVSSRSALVALSLAAGDSAILTEAGREGLFRWSGANHSSGFKAVSNHVNTAVTANGGGWFGIEKTGARTAPTMPGPFRARRRRVRSQSGCEGGSICRSAT